MKQCGTEINKQNTFMSHTNSQSVLHRQSLSYHGLTHVGFFKSKRWVWGSCGTAEELDGTSFITSRLNIPDEPTERESEYGEGVEVEV